MIGWAQWLPAMMLACAAAACGGGAAERPRPHDSDATLSPEQRDAEALGREIFEVVDRAVEYRGSHRGRPGASLPQMGIESLTASTVRRVVNVQREPVVTAAFRRPDGREIVSCRGDSQILVEASLKGRFTLMCSASSGAQRPMEVGERPER